MYSKCQSSITGCNISPNMYGEYSSIRHTIYIWYHSWHIITTKIGGL